MSRADLIVVAGEASGDRAAAAVISKLPPSVRAFGMGGGALGAEGVDLVADLRATTALGVAEVAVRALAIARAYARIRVAIARRKPAAALLVNYTEFNTRLARVLWARGTRVLWYGAPQIWAWRSARAIPLRRSIDRMAVMLPFEEPLWRSLGVNATYVGHPALEERRGDRLSARELLGLTPQAWAVALLPGSRPHEVRRLLAPMLVGYEAVRKEHASVDARLLLASSLDGPTRDWARAMAASAHVEAVDVDARAGMGFALPAFDAALCASGTASLECALARVVPVVCYRVGWVTELAARAVLKTAHVALPNILLGRAAFPELLQRRAKPTLMAKSLARALSKRDSYLGACTELEGVLGADTHKNASVAVARMLEPWLQVSAV